MGGGCLIGVYLLRGVCLELAQNIAMSIYSYKSMLEGLLLLHMYNKA